MVYYKVTESTVWVVLAESEDEAIEKVMNDPDGPDPVVNMGRKAEKMTLEECDEYEDIF